MRALAFLLVTGGATLALAWRSARRRPTDHASLPMAGSQVQATLDLVHGLGLQTIDSVETGKRAA